METKELVFTEELAEQLLEEEGLEHPDTERLMRYVWLVQKYPLHTQRGDYYRENLWKWVRDEQEAFVGEFVTPAEFAEFWYENYETEWRAPEWVVIDWEATWVSNLSYDFHAEYNGRGFYFWSNIY